jgi:hypothetical protein
MRGSLGIDALPSELFGPALRSPSLVGAADTRGQLARS